MNIKVSVIIPVYNAEEYLEQCLVFLSKQTLEEIEFITINDASTDKSLRILRKYKSKLGDKLILINSKENRGPGGARNLGIEAARGEYIGFVDSDDAMNPKMFETLYEKAKEKDYDIVDCAYYDEKSKDDFFQPPECFADELNEEKRGTLIRTTGFLWSKLVKKSLIEEMSMKFRENIIYEDIDYLCELFYRAKSIGGVPVSLYFYRYNDTSASRKLPNEEQLIYRIEECMKAMQERMKRCNISPAIRECFEFVMINVSTDLLTFYIKNDKFCVGDVMKFDKILKKYVPNYQKNPYISKVKNENAKIGVVSLLSTNMIESYSKLSEMKKNIKWEN